MVFSLHRHELCLFRFPLIWEIQSDPILNEVAPLTEGGGWGKVNPRPPHHLRMDYRYGHGAWARAIPKQDIFLDMQEISLSRAAKDFLHSWGHSLQHRHQKSVYCSQVAFHLGADDILTHSFNKLLQVHPAYLEQLVPLLLSWGRSLNISSSELAHINRAIWLIPSCLHTTIHSTLTTSHLWNDR